MKPITKEKAFWYIKQVCFEETLFRVIILGFLPCNLMLVVSSLIYAMSHLILFKWQFALMTLPLGLFLGWTYLALPCPVNFVVVVVIHFAVGSLAYAVGLTNKWEKK